ncbi:hypothetical protein BdWA1_000047 [Babesia duncani]|uniref:DUF6832 domain-containing protein n=1 Tax=Babesia duncani TaxID=323732 RepID=A0AAD9UPM9_9APIC|nr:hypothetical protein BdWA1_000047 [Babesia duncani]
MLFISKRLKGLQLHVATGQIATREYLESFEPKGLKRLKVFDTTPPDDLKKSFFDKLSSNYSNPRSILRLYRNYIAVDDYPCYSWLVRCLCQLGNSFSFNSFWSSSDRQALVQLPLFKYLIYDLIERKRYIHPRHVPRILFALAALEYRCWPLLSHLTPIIEKHVQDWSLSAISCMTGCLALMGIGNTRSDVINILLNEVENRDPSTATTFDWALLAYTLVLTNKYEWYFVYIYHFLISRPSLENAALPQYLARCCQGLNLENLPLSGWNQYILYLCLYCTDVEKPQNEFDIKRAVPFEFQESLHIRWLNEIVIHAQNQVWQTSDHNTLRDPNGYKRMWIWFLKAWA